MTFAVLGPDVVPGKFGAAERMASVWTDRAVLIGVTDRRVAERVVGRGGLVRIRVVRDRQHWLADRRDV